MGQLDYKWSTRDCLDQTKTLDLTIDPTKDSARNNGQPPATILIARLIQAVVRRCPNLAITLRFAHCQCRFTPILALGDETFPRVTKLVLYVGRHDLEETHGRSLTECGANAQFWRPFVGGISFPDCLKLEIRHYWATTPPKHASLDLEKQHSTHGGFPHGGYPLRRDNRGRHAVIDGNTTDRIGITDGLRKFESIMLECPPELNSPLLMQLLGNPNSVASNLVNLELRFCNLDYETISKLLYHAPPNLKRFVLLCCDSNPNFGGFDHREGPHLCPLIREFAKNLFHLEFGASTICRELFFDDLERQSLSQNGVITALGTTGGAIEGSERLDAHAIREIIHSCRKQKKTTIRNGRIDEAILTAKAQDDSTGPSSSLFGSTVNPNSTASGTRREAEALLDEEDERRSRLIEGSKTPWFRRIVTWHGLCYPNDTWAEIELAADMEEKAVEWILASRSSASSTILEQGNIWLTTSQIRSCNWQVSIRMASFQSHWI